ncbi:MAG: VWA domain-containing protein [Acidimicrobiia bacterium]|nr:VWA domain-containing protein [Acidimicrobiia bacterium]
MAHRFRYSRWDGSQKGFDLDALDLLDKMADQLAYNGDPLGALRRLMERGMQDRNGEHVQGLDDIINQLEARKEELLESGDLGGVYAEIAEALEEIVEREHQGLEDRHTLADLQLHDPSSTEEDRRNADLAKESASAKQLQLDMLADDLANRVQSLQSYDFESNEAQTQFDELLDKLRQEMVNNAFDQTSESLQNMSSDDLTRQREMMNALNDMLEQREMGIEPDFDAFMEEYGDFFPGNPQSLDELLEQLADQMAAAQAMFNSMSPEQQEQLRQLMDNLLQDMGLRDEMDRLSQNLQNAMPDAGWGESYQMMGGMPMGMGEAQNAMRQMGMSDRIRNFLQQVRDPRSLTEADIDGVRELLGNDAAHSLERMASMVKEMEDAGLIHAEGSRMELTARGVRKLGQSALKELFEKLDPGMLGGHDIDRVGIGHERSFQTKPYEYGDPFNLHIGRTIRNAVQRAGGGTPVQLDPDDFEIEQTEQSVASSTVLLLDISYSMVWEGRFLPAKKVALALQTLITGQYPKDYFGLVAFNRDAREVKAQALPTLDSPESQGTNLQYALYLARRLLARQSGTKQIICITDGEPTAWTDEYGSHFDWPDTYHQQQLALLEAQRCTKAGITINTFMLGDSRGMIQFVNAMAQINKGRVFHTNPWDLGSYIFQDFLSGKQKMI